MFAEYGRLTFERPGHASVRIETDSELVVYIDPWSKVIDGTPMDGDVVLTSHDDFDHYDPEAIEAVANENGEIVAYEAVDTSDLNRKVIPLGYESSLSVAGIDVKAVPAYNREDGEHVDENGVPFHGRREVIGFLLEFDTATVYFTSDTDFLPVHSDIRAGVFIPPIGGTYTMDRHEAVAFSESVEADLVLPVHYNTFDAIETDAQAFQEDVEKRGPKVELF